MFIRIGIASRFLGVCVKTLQRYDAEGVLTPNHRTKGGHRRYSIKQIRLFRGDFKEDDKAAAIYARVSAHKQKDDLRRQLEYLQKKANQAGFNEVLQYKDIASGVNDNRKGLLRLLKDGFEAKFTTVYISHNDRLARFGVTLIQFVFKMLGIKIIRTKEALTNDSSSEKFVEDILAILTSYAGRLHRLRRNSFTKQSAQKT